MPIFNENNQVKIGSGLAGTDENRKDNLENAGPHRPLGTQPLFGSGSGALVPPNGSAPGSCTQNTGLPTAPVKDDGSGPPAGGTSNCMTKFQLNGCCPEGPPPDDTPQPPLCNVKNLLSGSSGSSGASGGSGSGSAPTSGVGGGPSPGASPSPPFFSGGFGGSPSISGFQNLYSSGGVTSTLKVATGNLFHQTALAGISTVARGFDSSISHSSLQDTSGSLGANRMHNYEMNLDIGMSSVTLMTGGAQEIHFTSNGSGGWDYDSTNSLYEDLSLDNPSGDTWTVTDNLTETVWEFDGAANGRLDSITDRKGNEVTLTYNGSGELTTVTENQGRTFQYGYTSGQLTSFTDPKGNTTLFFYDSFDNITQIAGPEGCTTTFGYTNPSDNLVTSVTDARGNTTNYEYDNDRRLTKVTDPEGREISYAYETRSETMGDNGGSPATIVTADFDTTLVTFPGNRVFELRFDGAGNLWRSVLPSGVTRRYIWNEQQRLLYASEGFEMRYDVWDGDGNPIPGNGDTNGLHGPADNQLNRTLRRSLSARGDVTAQMDSTGLVDIYEYDAAGRLLSIHPGHAHYGIQGAWTDDFGSDGIILCGFNEDNSDVYQNPSYLNPSLSLAVTNGNTSGGNTYSAVNFNSINIHDPRVPVESKTSPRRGAGHWKQTSPDGVGATLEFSINLSADQEFNLSLYSHSVDQGYPNSGYSSPEYRPLKYFEQFGRDLEFTVEDLEGTQVYRLHNNASGVWVTFPVHGDDTNPVKVTVTAQGFTDQAMISAIAFDPHHDRRTNYEYTDGFLTKVTNALGEETRYAYNTDGTLDTMTDGRNKVTSYDYLDAYKNLTKITDAENNVTQFEYDLNGNVEKIIDGNLLETVMTYDGKDRLLTSTDDLGHQISYDYDGNGNLISVKDAEDNYTFYTYTSTNRLESVTNALAETVTMEYDERDLLSKVTDSRGFVTTYSYNDDGELVSVETPDGEKSTMSYDTLQQLVAITGPNGNQSDVNDILLKGAANLFLNPDAEKEDQYWGHDYPHSWFRDQNRVARSNTESAKGEHSLPFSQVGQKWEQDSIKAPLGAQMLARAQFKPTVENAGVDTILKMEAILRNIEGTKDTSSQTTTLPGSTNDWVDSEPFFFQIPGKAQTTFSNPTLDLFSLELEQLGGVTTADAWVDDMRLHSLSTTYTRDMAGRLKTVVSPDGAEVRLLRDRLGRVIAWQDPQGHTTELTYDTLDRVKNVLTPDGEMLEYEFDEVGNLISFEDGKGQITTFQYDDINRLVKIIHPDITEEIFGYDSGSRLTSYTDNAGQTRTFSYDDGNRLQTVTYSTDSTTISLTHDKVGNILTYTDRNGDVTTYTYDDVYRPTTVARVAGSGNDTPDWNLSHSYNDAGARIQVTEGQTPVVLWESSASSNRYGTARYGQNNYGDGYDEMGRLNGVVGPNGLSISYTYDHESRLKEATCGNGVTTSTDYDIMGRLVGLQVNDGSSDLLDIAYQYDQKSQRVAQVSNDTSFDYKIDNEGRLVGEAVNRFVQTSDDFKKGTVTHTTTTALSGITLINHDDTFASSDLDCDLWRVMALRDDPLERVLGFEVRQQNEGVMFSFPRGYTNNIVYRELNQPVRDAYGLRSFQLNGIGMILAQKTPLTGDFDLIIDFENLQTEIAVGGGVNYSVIGIRVSDTIDDLNDPGTFLFPNYVGNEQTGKLRITRTGSSLQRQVWNNSTSSWNGPYGGWTATYSGDLYISLMSYANNDAVLCGTFKNLTSGVGYTSSGEFESATYDAGRSVTWDNISWKETLPTGCDVEFQIAVSSSEDGPWTYVGPDGTAGTKFSTASGQSVGTSVTGRYLRTKAFLSGTGTDTPILSEVHVSHSGTVNSQYTSFTYDDAGNLTIHKVVTDSSEVTETRMYNNQNEITTNAVDDGSTVVNWTYAHDANGNLTSKTDGTDTWTYAWDDENRLTSVTKNSTLEASYKYDSNSRLLQRVAGGTTTNYTWDGWDLVKEVKTGTLNETTRYAVPQGGVQSFERDGSRFYLHGDGLSSSQLVTDSSGSQAARIVYGAWGNELSATDSVPGGLEQRFVGGLGVRNDNVTGLIYMRHRWYDATLQRFISRDPIGLKGGNNLYEYAGNNPMTTTDHTGLQPGFPEIPIAPPSPMPTPVRIPNSSYNNVTIITSRFNVFYPSGFISMTVLSRCRCPKGYRPIKDSAEIKVVKPSEAENFKGPSMTLTLKRSADSTLPGFSDFTFFGTCLCEPEDGCSEPVKRYLEPFESDSDVIRGVTVS